MQASPDVTIMIVPHGRFHAERWLHTVVLGAVEFQQNSFRTISNKQLATTDRRLGQCEIAAAESIVASVGGHPVSRC